MDKRLIRQIKLGRTNLNGLAWDPDGARFAVACGDLLRIYASNERLIHTLEGHSDRIQALDWAPAPGAGLASGDVQGSLRLWNPDSGRSRQTLSGHGDRITALAWSPGGGRLASASKDHSARIWDGQTGALHHTLGGPRPATALCWSPDSSRLAVAFSADDASDIHLYSAEGEALVQWTLAPAKVHALGWSRQDRLAVADEQNRVSVYEVAEGRVFLELEGHTDPVEAVSWSPDGAYLVTGADDHKLRVWKGDSGQLVETGAVHQDIVRCLAFSRDGARLVSGDWDGRICMWSMSGLSARELTWAAIQASSVGRRASARPDRERLPRLLAALPGQCLALHRLDLAPPLSWIRALLHLLGGSVADVALNPPAAGANAEGTPHDQESEGRAEGALSRPAAGGSAEESPHGPEGEGPAEGEFTALERHSGIQAMAGLRWPTEARAGLIAFLFQDLTMDSRYAPPGDIPPTELARDLLEALAGESVEADGPPIPVAAIARNADRVDGRLLTLLEILRPEAVAADPGLPLRLFRLAPRLPPMSKADRAMLGLRLRRGAPGRAQGSGLGGAREGIDNRGPFSSLVPSQHGLPLDLLAYRGQEGTLLFRAHAGEEPPRRRPMVVVLDVSPPVFGPVEGLTRLAAHTVCATLLEAGVRTLLLFAGGPCRVRELRNAADLPELWIARTRARVHVRETLETAARYREQLFRGPLEPAILLLTHAWFGAEESAREPVEGLRGLFVQYPGQQVEPQWARHCMSKETLASDAHGHLGEVLGRLVG